MNETLKKIVDETTQNGSILAYNGKFEGDEWDTVFHNLYKKRFSQGEVLVYCSREFLEANKQWLEEKFEQGTGAWVGNFEQNTQAWMMNGVFDFTFQRGAYIATLIEKNMGDTGADAVVVPMGVPNMDMATHLSTIIVPDVQ